ncbi:MAG: stage II sporulation protein R [Bacillota bacterium]
MRKNILPLFLLILLTGYISLSISSALALPANQEYDISDKLLRLHVVANSNTPVDQKIKRSVRQSILKYLKDCNNLSFKKNNFKLQNIVNEILEDNNVDYEANINVGQYLFPRRTYGNLSLPSGEYRALKIELGEAKGSNWWCVLNPPICLPQKNANNKDQLKISFKLIKYFSFLNFESHPEIRFFSDKSTLFKIHKLLYSE